MCRETIDPQAILVLGLNPMKVCFEVKEFVQLESHTYSFLHNINRKAKDMIPNILNILKIVASWSIYIAVIGIPLLQYFVWTKHSFHT